MKNNLLSFALVSLVLQTFGAHLAVADVVILKGGDRLSGTIVSKDEKQLTLQTVYAKDPITLLWSEVTNIETDEPARFMLKDKTLINAQATPSGESTVVLKSGEAITTAPLPMSDITYINPPPHVSGEGVSFSGRANLGLTANRGNTDTDQLFYDAEAVARSLKNRFTIGATGVNAKDEGEDTTRNNRAYMQYDHFLTEQWYGYANTDFQEDKFADLNLRTTLGVGAGYQFFDSTQRSLSLEAGPSYVNEDYKTAEDDSFTAARWGLQYRENLFGDALQFFHNNEGIVSVEDTDDMIFRAQTGVRFPVIEHLSGTIQYNIDWQNTPPDGFDSTDSGVIVSMGYLW